MCSGRKTEPGRNIPGRSVRSSSVRPARASVARVSHYHYYYYYRCFQHFFFLLCFLQKKRKISLWNIRNWHTLILLSLNKYCSSIYNFITVHWRIVIIIIIYYDLRRLLISIKFLSSSKSFLFYTFANSLLSLSLCILVVNVTTLCVRLSIMSLSLYLLSNNSLSRSML